jgi:hypothetical protein
MHEPAASDQITTQRLQGGFHFRGINGLQLIVCAFAVVFWKKMEVSKLRLAVSVERIKGKGHWCALPPSWVDVGIKARSLCDLCHSRRVSGNVYRPRTAVTFIGAYDYF